jgi:glycosyltransferase involved in cell wall biosynthesis
LKIVYSAPNRAHHYVYARQLHQAGILGAFVSGFSRYSPRSPIPEIGNALRRVDHLQTLYIASLKFRMPAQISEELAHWAKIQIDRGSRGPLKHADVFLFYNGCGLDSARRFRRNGGMGIVEAVNTHVLVQEQLLAEEQLGLPWRPFHTREVARRVAEVEEAEYVLLPSSFVARSFLAKGIPRERLLRVPYPMQKIAGGGASSEKPIRDDGVFRVLYVGTISVRKGLRYLIEGFRLFKHAKKELWIVGPTAKPSGLENMSLPEGVKFFGPLKGEALEAVYLSATVFCLPSIEEGLALVLMEAIYYGLPVIATENTGIEDLLPEGKAGMVVPIRDAGAIGACLNRLAEDGNLLEKKRVEAVETKSRLAIQSQSSSALASTLMETFRHHGSAKSSENS